MSGRLIVEGYDDKYVVEKLCNKVGFSVNFNIQQSEGYENAREAFGLDLKVGNFERLGILVDADTDISSRWKSLRDVLLNVGYSVELEPAPNGLIIHDVTKDVPFVGIWLMPNNTIPGILEDFIGFLVPKGDKLLKHSVCSVDSLPEKRFKESYQSKAIIHTWLAWQKEPGTPLSAAITKNYLDCDKECVRSFVGWLNCLFNIQS